MTSIQAVKPMSNINHNINYRIIADRLTPSRLSSYLDATDQNTEDAIDLYDWNTRVGAALYEDISRLEVVFRNTVDDALTDYGSTQGWQNVWYRRTQLFPGQHAYRTRADINTARRRATSQGQRSESHDKVITALNRKSRTGSGVSVVRLQEINVLDLYGYSNGTLERFQLQFDQNGNSSCSHATCYQTDELVFINDADGFALIC